MERLLAAHTAYAGAGGAFLLATVGDEVAGCVALAPPAGDATEDTGEVKRMFVTPQQRRRGVGAALLATLEAEAQRLGYRRLCLETGSRQPEAVALYAQAGYTPIAPYGPFTDDPSSICLGKSLTSPS